MNNIASYALEKALKSGADKAACRVESGRKDELNVEANKFSLLRTLFEDELTLKVLIGGRKGTMTINKLEKDAVDKAIDECISMAKASSPDEAEDIAPLIENKNFNRNIGGANMDHLFSRTKEFIQQVRNEFPQISMDLQSYFQGGKSTYLNSNGVEFHDESEHYTITPVFSAKDGEASSSFNYYEVLMDSLAQPFLELGMLRTLISESARSIKTRMVDDKFVGKIILTPACMDMVWFTLISCFLNNGSMIAGTSRWKDALGTQVADKKLTFSATPFNPANIAGERFTNDGFLSEDFDYIKDGILNSFALNLYGANKTAKPRAANSAMWNMEVAGGDVALQDMIKSVDKGILVNRFSGAQPGPSGDISGVAKNSFLIENGQVTDAVSETMLSFNVVDILQDITAISKERIVNGIYVLPWCCFDGITISGK